MFESAAKAILLASILLVVTPSISLGQPSHVIGVRVEANPVEFRGVCPATITFTGKIRMNGPGVVRYVWRRSDGARAPSAILNFQAAGEQEVTTTWRLGGPGFPDRVRWEAIRILYPNMMTSNRAEFRVHCGDAVDDEAARASEATGREDNRRDDVKVSRNRTEELRGPALPADEGWQIFELSRSATMMATPEDCSHQISGRVTRGGSAPDAGVEMHLLGGARRGDRMVNTDNTGTVPTDDTGRYAFANLCPGTYRIRPGPAWWENAMLPSPYTPSSQEVTIPAGNVIQRGHDGPVYIKGIDFQRTAPPGVGEPQDLRDFVKEKIKIDESVRAGRDLRFAQEIEQFLESTLPCKERLCDLTIKVRNGRAAIAGAMDPNERPLLDKLAQAIGANRLDISGVKGHINPF